MLKLITKLCEMQKARNEVNNESGLTKNAKKRRTQRESNEKGGEEKAAEAEQEDEEEESSAGAVNEDAIFKDDRLGLTDTFDYAFAGEEAAAEAHCGVPLNSKLSTYFNEWHEQLVADFCALKRKRSSVFFSIFNAHSIFFSLLLSES